MSRYPARPRYISSPQDVYKAQDAEGAFSEADWIPQEEAMPPESAEVVQERLDRLGAAVEKMLTTVGEALDLVKEGIEQFGRDVEKIR